MRCSIGKPVRDGQNPPQIPVSVTFEAICRGMNHPGVETSVALDVMMDTFGANVDWTNKDDILAKGEEEMAVFGSQEGNEKGVVTGWSWDVLVDQSVPPTPTDDQLSRPSTPARQLSSTITPSSPSTPERRYERSKSMSRLPISASTTPGASATLLRAPLPGSQAGATPDYSFESGHPEPTSLRDVTLGDDGPPTPDGYFPSRTLSRRSSFASTSASAGADQRTLTDKKPTSEGEIRHPTESFNVHLNLLPLITGSNPSASPTLKANLVMDVRFTIQANLLLSGTALDPYHVPLPVIRIPGSTSHSCHIAVKADLGHDISISPPALSGGNRVAERVGNSGAGVSTWQLEIAPNKWSESLSAVVDDEWAEDCMLLVLPLPKKPSPTQSQPRSSPLSSPRLVHLQAQSVQAQSNYQSSVQSYAPSTSPVESRSSHSMSVASSNRQDRTVTLPPATPAPPGSYTKSQPVSENTTPTMTRRTPQPLPHSISLDTSGIFETPQRPSPQRAQVVDRSGHSWVEIDVTPIPPDPKDKERKSWSIICRMRLPWPSVSAGGGQRSDFGFLRPENLKSSKSTELPQTRIIDASIDGRKAEVQIFASAADPSPSLFGSPRSPLKEPEDEGSFREWLNYIRITDPEARYGGTLEVLYHVYGFGSRIKSLDILLPTFTVPVTRLEVTVGIIAGMSIPFVVQTSKAHLSFVDFEVHSKSHNFAISSQSPLRYQHLGLEPFYRPTLAIAVSSSKPSVWRHASQAGSFLLRGASLVVIAMMLLHMNELQERVEQISKAVDALQAGSQPAMKHSSASSTSFDFQWEAPEEDPRPKPSPVSPAPTSTSSSIPTPEPSVSPELWTSSDSLAPPANPTAGPAPSYRPSIPFPELELDDLPNLASIPVTPTYTPIFPTPTDVAESPYSNPNTIPKSHLGALLAGTLDDPLSYLLHHLSPQTFARKVWRIVILLLQL